MSLAPKIKWSQDENNLNLVIQEPDMKNIDFNFENSKFTFKGESNNNIFQIELNLNNEINIGESKFHIGSFSCNVTLVKKEKLWWNYLVKEKKLPNLEIDWNKWKDVDESDDELFDYNIPNNLEELMK